jgi:hypothetical protein
MSCPLRYLPGYLQHKCIQQARSIRGNGSEKQLGFVLVQEQLQVLCMLVHICSSGNRCLFVTVALEDICILQRLSELGNGLGGFISIFQHVLHTALLYQ